MGDHNGDYRPQEGLSVSPSLSRLIESNNQRLAINASQLKHPRISHQSDQKELKRLVNIYNSGEKLAQLKQKRKSMNPGYRNHGDRSSIELPDIYGNGRVS